MIYDASINGLPVRARYADKTVRDVFLPLLHHLTALHEAAGQRTIVFLAAPPATGKSTLCAFLEHLSSSEPGLSRVQAIGIDGFHRRQEYLETHTMTRDGQLSAMARYKGAYETFDVGLLGSALESLDTEDTCPWPAYDRTIHDPLENAMRVTAPIALLEGNYLLSDLPAWRDLLPFASYTISIVAPLDLLRKRLVARKMAGGFDRQTAERFVQESDLYNARLVMSTMQPADLELSLRPDGSLCVVDNHK